MKVSDSEKTRLMLMSNCLDRSSILRPGCQKIKFSHALWFLYPLVLYYSWNLVL